MSGDIVALVIAIVGVMGTLTSPIIAQRLAMQAKREESEREREREIYKDKRASYINFIAASRQYRIVINEYLYAVNEKRVGDTEESDLRKARRTYNAAYAAAQLMASTPVLEIMYKANRQLARAFGYTKSFESGNPQQNMGFQEIEQFIRQAWNYWSEMSKAMRRELGIPD